MAATAAFADAARVTVIVLACVASCWCFRAHAQAGYEVTKAQTVTNPPPGYVGRKTTDTEKRVGNTDATRGSALDFAITIGGFVKKCPTADGLVAGTFEYTLTANEIAVVDGREQPTHYTNQVLATLQGHVRDDARLDHVDIEADVSREHDGATSRQHVRSSFRLGEGGAADIGEMLRTPELSSDVLIAAVVWSASPVYADAEREWVKLNECVETVFDPPTRTVALGPNASKQVRMQLRAKEGGGIVASGKVQGGALDNVGTLEPRKGDIEDGALPFTYTASAHPKKGHGFDFGATSPAGQGGDKWQILDSDLRLTFELSFVQAGEDFRGDVRVKLPETKLEAQPDGSYRGAGEVQSTGTWRAAECAMDANFTTTVQIVARAEDAERTRFKLELLPNEPTHLSTMRCEDLSMPVALPLATWLVGPTVNPAVLGQAVPVANVAPFPNFRASVEGSVLLAPPQAEP